MKIIKKCVLAFVLAVITQYSLAERNLKLVFAFDLVRHGDRAPSEYIPEISTAWKESELGQLTELGAENARLLGGKFQKYYVNKTHLLPENFDASLVSVKSTNYQRTMETASNIMKGFYPKNASQINVETKSFEEDVVMRNRGKIRKQEFRELAKINAERASKSQIDLYKNVRKALDELNQVFGTHYSSVGQFTEVADVIKISKIHKRPLLKEIGSDLTEKIIDLLPQTRLQWFHDEPEVPCIYAKDFVLYAADSIEHKAVRPKYILQAAHDTTILASTFLLGTPSAYNPPYLSDLRFEIFQDTKTNEAFVKTSLNGETLKVCPNQELCPVSNFVQTLRTNVANKCK